MKFDEEEDEEEELYELASVANGEPSDLSSDAEGGQAEEQLQTSESNEKDASSCQSETLFHNQKEIIEDIRFVISSSSINLIHYQQAKTPIFLLVFFDNSSVCCCI